MAFLKAKRKGDCMIFNFLPLTNLSERSMTNYLYHKVITRFVRFALWSPENERARPKSASFRFPSLSIRRLDPATIDVEKKSCWLQKYIKSSKR